MILKKLLLSISTVLIGHQLATAQTPADEKFILNGRERDSTWFRYKKGSNVVIGMPLIGAYYNNLDPAQTYYSIRLGLRMGYGRFIAESFMLGSTFEFDFTNMQNDLTINTQTLSLMANYFFLPNARLSPFISLNPYIQRFNYLPTAKLFFDDRDLVNGKRKTHLLPHIAIMSGLSIKIKKHLTLQAGVGVKYNFKEIYKEGEKLNHYSPDMILNLSYHF